MHSLQHHHTFGLHASCRDLRIADTVESLLHYLSQLKSQPFLVLGEGSNCIFVEDYSGTVVLNRLRGKHVEEFADHTLVTVHAGENWHEFVAWCLGKGLFGLENLALIPGTVGAAPIQNIGAYGVEVESWIQHVEYLDLDAMTLRTLSNEQCRFGYRDSIFKHQLENKAVVTKVCFRFPKQWQPVASYAELAELDTPTPQDIFKSVIAIRQAKLPDPARVGNAGSFFKNPVIEQQHFAALKNAHPTMPGYAVNHNKVKIPAAWLIDNAGFKGQSRDGIQCHTKQALVLTNYNHGTGKALLAFAREIRDQIKAQYYVELINEVRLIGQHGLVNL